MRCLAIESPLPQQMQILMLLSGLGVSDSTFLSLMQDYLSMVGGPFACLLLHSRIRACQHVRTFPALFIHRRITRHFVIAAII
jgi:hypothetical protein